MIKIFDTEIDNVINGIVVTASVDYETALKKLVPLINKTEFQRKLQDKTFYQKLERDLEDGCVMPPITVAFVNKSINIESSSDQISSFIEKNLDTAFVLDGIQRLNTLSRLSESKKINFNKRLYLNFIFCDSEDKLLYRMITLNNGQRPMTPRHQVEMMMANVFDFSSMGIAVQTEKERAEKTNLKSFNKSDLVQAYLAFMANSPIIDNKKIIEEKMDELLVGKIISTDPLEYKSQFIDVLKALSRFQHNAFALTWLKIANNLVGFSVGMKKSNQIILNESTEDFVRSIQKFDEAFADFNPSKIKVGKYRRELSCEYFKNYEALKNYNEINLLEYFSDYTNE